MTKNKIILPKNKHLLSHIELNSNIILIDGSYFVFYRFYALLAWWKLRHEDTYDDLKESPISNKEFLSQFHKLCEKYFLEIHKKYRIAGSDIPFQLVIAKDCPRSQIWRTSIFPKYKDTRANNTIIGPIFAYFYDQIVPNSPHILLEHAHLEADDCIAITTQYIREHYEEQKGVVIIASDKDYVQLLDSDKVEMVDLKFKKIGNNNVLQDNKYELFCKIINGDKSDNICSVFDKMIGKQKMLEFYENNSVLDVELEAKGKKEKYEWNRKLIDFLFIPLEYKCDFVGQYLTLL